MPTPDGFVVRLSQQDADHLLALGEWAVNHPDVELGPGLRLENAELALRKIESVAVMHRRGFTQGGDHADA